VAARTSNLIIGAGKVFQTNAYSNNGNAVETWTDSVRQLKIQFAHPVSAVSLMAYNGVADGYSLGRLEAYDSSGKLLDRFTTDVLDGDASELMSISRETSDIAYVIAGGHAGTEVVLDTLNWGAATSGTTNTQGAFSLTGFPDGVYHVKVIAPPAHVVTTPAGGIATVNVVNGQALGGAVYFGISSNPNVFYNASNPLNVNDDSGNNISSIDALLVINWLNNHAGESELPSDGDPTHDGFVDVNNDGHCSSIDALLVINYLNSHHPGGGGGEGESQQAAAANQPPAAPAWSAPAASPSAPEGEGGPTATLSTSPSSSQSTPQNAAQYYAQAPVHFLHIVGTDKPCNCPMCVAQRSASDSSTASDGATPSQPAGSALEQTLNAIAGDVARGGGIGQ
jgi:hypothetical protein